jgi:hypothetical protein
VTIYGLRAETLRDPTDVLVYQLGKAQVDALDTVRFVPSALAPNPCSATGALR